MSQTIHHQVVIVGGGTAGISVAARLTNGWFNKRDVAVIEPADTHYYQPLWTLEHVACEALSASSAVLAWHAERLDVKEPVSTLSKPLGKRSPS